MGIFTLNKMIVKNASNRARTSPTGIGTGTSTICFQKVIILEWPTDRPILELPETSSWLNLFDHAIVASIYLRIGFVKRFLF